MKRPLIISAPISEFGETDASYTAEDRMTTLQEDHQYVPGFSDMRYQREIEMAEYHEGTRDGKDVSHLPANCYWVRRTTPSGKTDQMKLMGKKMDGYRPVLKDDVGKPWLTGLVDGWNYTPEGHIMSASGELQLVVLEGAAAANRARKKERKWLDKSASVQKEPEGKWKREVEMQGKNEKGEMVSVADLAIAQEPEGKGRIKK